MSNQSAFKQLYTEMFAKDGNFGTVKDSFKKPLKCFVKETFPYFLVSDGFFYVQAYFTKDAVTDFKKKFSSVNICDLTNKVVVLNDWHLEMRRSNTNEVFTSYANIEVRLAVSSFKCMLQEKVNPTRFPSNLFRDDEFKTLIQNYRHKNVQNSLSKNSKNETLPDVSAVSEAKKGSIESKGVVAIKTGGKKGDDEFGDYQFKEGNTAVTSMQAIAEQEKGKNFGKKPAASSSQPKVAGGAKGKKKAASKAKGKRAASSDEAPEVRARVGKVLMYTPSKTVIATKNTPSKGKSSAAGKKSTSGKKTTPTMASPGGKDSKKRTTDQMSMAKFKEFMKWQEGQKGAKASTSKILGKRSGKASAASGKASTRSGQKKK